MFGRVLFTFICSGLFSVAVAFGQTTIPDKVPAKINARPTPTPTPPTAEPFDKADVKTMAEKCVRLETESGIIEIELYPESAPESVRNFLNLTAIGAFDTTTFSRVVPNFVIQGGDLYTREAKMTSAFGMRARKTIPDEPNKILHERGILSMARSDEPEHGLNTFLYPRRRRRLSKRQIRRFWPRDRGNGNRRCYKQSDRRKRKTGKARSD